jgi:protein transport protein SEC31
LGNIYNLYVEYAWIAASNGKVEVAWRFLELVPIDFIPTVSLPVDIFVLRDRIYSSRDFKLSVTGRPPAFPFEIVDVIDFEAKQRAEKLRQEQLNRQAQAAKPQAPYNPYQSQPAQAYGGYENQPSGYGQQWQQPPLPTPPMNQWSQPPQNWNSQPVMNSWNQNQPMTSNQGWNTMNAMPVAPPPVQQFVPPPINQGWNPSVATPPVTQQPFIPPPPQGRSTATSSGTGHAPPIPATFQPPTYNPPHQATTSSFERKKSFVSNPMSPPPIPAQAPPKPDPLATMNPIEKQCYNGLVNLWKKLESETTSVRFSVNIVARQKKCRRR